jgi:hypothetical protein
LLKRLLPARRGKAAAGYDVYDELTFTRKFVAGADAAGPSTPIESGGGALRFVPDTMIKDVMIKNMGRLKGGTA